MYAATRGSNMKGGAHIWNEGQGTTDPPLATTLFLLYEYGFILVCNLGLFEIMGALRVTVEHRHLGR